MLLNSGSKLKVLVIGLVVSSCASFEPALRFQDLNRPRQPTAREVREGLEVSVEEFVSSNKSNQAFDADIGPYGVLALLVRVENAGTENYKVQKNEIKASLGGQMLSQLSGEEAANQAATSEYAGKALFWTALAGPFAIIAWPATIAGSTANTHAVNRRVQQHFESLQFTDALLKPNQTAAGFIYLKLPGGVKRLEKLTIELEPSEEKTGKRLSYKLSLPDLTLSAPVSSPTPDEPGEGG